MNWHSDLSFYTDLLLGAVPALVGVLCLGYMLLGGLLLSGFNALYRADPLVYAMLALGLLAASSLLYTSLVRERVRFRPFLISSLAAGVVLTAVLVTLISQLEFPQTLWFVTVPAVSMSVIACKHIILLVRTQVLA